MCGYSFNEHDDHAKLYSTLSWKIIIRISNSMHKGGSSISRLERHQACLEFYVRDTYCCFRLILRSLLSLQQLYKDNGSSQPTKRASWLISSICTVLMLWMIRLLKVIFLYQSEMSNLSILYMCKFLKYLTGRLVFMLFSHLYVLKTLVNVSFIKMNMQLVKQSLFYIYSFRLWKLVHLYV